MRIGQQVYDFLKRRRQHYQLTFAGPVQQQVLADLAVFCRANESCWHPDPRQHAVLEGRREVWLRIQNHLNLKPEQLYALYARRDQPLEKETT